MILCSHGYVPYRGSDGDCLDFSYQSFPLDLMKIFLHGKDSSDDFYFVPVVLALFDFLPQSLNIFELCIFLIDILLELT